MTIRLTFALALLAGAASAGSPPDGHATAQAADTTVASPAKHSLFVSVPPLFGELKRAPVLFPHDKHTAELSAEGCRACHPSVDGKIAFTFPIQRNEKSAGALMDSIHDACISCHKSRSGEGKESGPVTCGECHSDKKAFHAREYLPALPRDYDALRDPQHKQCIQCHKSPSGSHGPPPDLDWKSFRVRAQKRIEIDMPEVVYDYFIHDKHLKVLDKRCDLCHYLDPTLKAKLAAEGKQPTSQDWLRQEEEGRSWKVRESAHDRCINCHLERKEQKKSGGPVACGECHTPAVRPLAGLLAIEPPDYGDKQRVLIHAEKASLPGVPFDHKSHIAASRSCGDCHHDTLESCAKCHTLSGAKEGGFVTLAEAYHDTDSTRSCIGCHAREQQKADCAGCHHLRPEGLAAGSCDACHSGNLESLDRARELPDPATLLPEGIKDELQISVLEKDYEKVVVQHTKIARKLTAISNGNRLSKAFHRDQTSICSGCHHLGPVEPGQGVPACVACHTVRTEPTGKTPTLLGAFHQACLGCHRKMNYPEEEMPQKCAGCHKEKTGK